MRSTPRLLFLLILTLVTSGACGDDDPAGEPGTDAGPEPGTIGEHVRVDDRFDTLEAAFSEAGLLEGLDEAGPQTLFAPTDDAFEQLYTARGLSEADLLALANLADVLRYHLHAGELTLEDLSTVTAITNSAGTEIHVRFGLEGIRLDDSLTIVSESIAADNGLIHILDVVLERPLTTTTRRFEMAPNLPIEDAGENGLGVTQDFVTIDEPGFVYDVQVVLDIDHPRLFDLIVFLERPQTESFVRLVFSPSFQSDIKTTIADSAVFDSVDDQSESDDPTTTPFTEAAYRPHQPLEFLVGEPVAGEWLLTIVDRFGGEVGTLNSWGLAVTYGPEAPGPAIAFDRPTGGSGVLPLGFREPFDVVMRRVGGLAGSVDLSATAGELEAIPATLGADENSGAVVFDVDPDTATPGPVNVSLAAKSGDISRVKPIAATIVPPDSSGFELLAHLNPSDLGAAGFEGNDIWGWTDPADGTEYALVGTEIGTTFVNLADPENPVVVGGIFTQTTASPWRDIKVHNNHAFIVSEASGHGMQVFDLTRLRGVTSPQTFAPDALANEFGNAHNIVINEDTGFAYVVGATEAPAESCFGGLLMYDLSTPTAPTSLGCFSGGVPVGEQPGPSFPTDAYIHDAQCVSYAGPDPDYAGREICISSDGQVFNDNNYVAIADVTDKNNVVQVARSTYDGAGYAHQGWLTEDHQFFILNDEFDEFGSGSNTITYVWDVRDLDAPTVLGTIINPRDAVGHNTYIKGNLAFQANYTSGLRVVDITDIANGNGTEIAYFDTFPGDDANDDGTPGGQRCSRPNPSLRGPILPHHPEQEAGCGQASFDGAWSNYPFFESGIIVVSDIQRGFFVLRPDASLAR